MTAGQILADLKALIGPGNIATDTQLYTWINESYQYMVDQINQTQPNYFTISALTDLVANQWEYAMPTDCERVIMANANFTGSWRRLTALQEINQIPVYQNINTSSGPIVFTELNPVYYEVGGNVGILPMPTANVTGGLKLWYVQQVADLTANDTPLFGARYHALIKLGAYANYLDLDDQHQAAEQKLQRFEQRVQSMCESIAERQQDDPKQIEIAEQGDLYFDSVYGDGIV